MCLRIFIAQIATFRERHPRETFEKLKGLKKFVKAFHWPSQSNWTSQRLVVLIARRNVMSWLLAKANVMKNGQMLSNQQLSPIFNTGHYSTMFWNASNCLISIFSTFEFENSRQIIPILIWIFGGKIPIFELIRCLFMIFQLFVYILKNQLFVYIPRYHVSCLFQS